MKTPIYVLVLLAVVLSGCTNDEIDNNIFNYNTTEGLINLESETQARGVSQILDVPMDDTACFRTQLIDEKLEPMGYVDFAVVDTDVIITFKTDNIWSLQETYLDVISCTSEVFPLDSNGNPVLSEFKYSTVNKFPVKRVDHFINPEDVNESICYAAYAIIIDDSGKSKEVWAHGWEIYTPAYLKSCLPESNDDEIQFCDENNKKVYICHNGQTICVSINAIDAHLAHGDSLGECED